jgi:uncharacterized protein YcbX
MPIHLKELHIYPVKSLGGIALKEAVLTPRGLAHDRRFLVVDDEGEFFTQRELPKMATVWMELDSETLSFSAPDLETVTVPSRPSPAPTRKVRVWKSIVDAHGVSPEVDAFLSAYLGERCQLVYMPDSSVRATNAAYSREGDHVSFADGYPCLLTNQGTLDDLNLRIIANGRQSIPMNRFRSNLVIEGAPAGAEDGWKRIRIGETEFRIAKPCVRCQVTTTDQAAGEVRGPEPLATLSTYRNSPDGPMFGQNMIPDRLGTLRVGDEVTILA